MQREGDRRVMCKIWESGKWSRVHFHFVKHEIKSFLQSLGTGCDYRKDKCGRVANGQKGTMIMIVSWIAMVEECFQKGGHCAK